MDFELCPIRCTKARLNFAIANNSDLVGMSGAPQEKYYKCNQKPTLANDHKMQNNVSTINSKTFHTHLNETLYPSKNKLTMPKNYPLDSLKFQRASTKTDDSHSRPGTLVYVTYLDCTVLSMKIQISQCHYQVGPL